MKVTSKRQENTFNPVTIEITIESQRELEELLMRVLLDRKDLEKAENYYGFGFDSKDVKPFKEELKKIYDNKR